MMVLCHQPIVFYEEAEKIVLFSLSRSHFRIMNGGFQLTVEKTLEWAPSLIDFTQQYFTSENVHIKFHAKG